MRFRSTLAAGLLLALTLATAGAADYSGPANATASPLAAARAQIAKQNWSAAVAELKKVNETGNADWNNLMGYSLRKGAAPDVAGAEQFYNEALRLDPKHKGALEYSGELYLMTGDLPKAEERLAALDKVCRLPCEEYTDLKKAVARFKANGNKYVAAP